MISVIVPVYNIESYVPACIRSIQKQTFPDFELLLVDDGSTDASGRLCDQFAEKDDRIRVIHKKNGGLSDARNCGTAQAQGEWITYVDGDDIAAPDYLRELYVNARRFRAQVSVVQIMKNGKRAERSGTGKKSGKTVQVLSGREAAMRIVYGNELAMIVAPGKLYHKNLKPYLFYPAGKCNEDEFVTYKALYHAGKVSVSPLAYYGYVTRDGSIMQSDYGICRLDKLQALQEAVDFFVDKGDKELASCAKLRYLLNLQICWYRVCRSPVIENKKRVLRELKERQRAYWRKEKKQIWRMARPAEKAAVFIFLVSPTLYAAFSRVYLSALKEK